MGARLAAGLGVVALVVANVGAAAAAPPTASGPLSPPPPASLTGPGWTVQEYFLSGTATAYARAGTWDVGGEWAVTPSTTAGYVTRALVRRPTDPARFNGTVVVEWLNVSAGFDNNPTLAQTRTHLLRNGYAWVGVSAQHLGVDGPGGLKANDPARYAALEHPGDSYSYDIFSQVGEQLRTPGAVDLLGGLHATRLLAAGQSQSASRLGTYINAVHPLAKVYDGFLVQDRTSNLAPLFDRDTGVPIAAHVRTDGAAPVLMVQAEGDIVTLRSHRARQDDSDRFRLWEVAGAAHADEYTLSPQATPQATGPGSPCGLRANSAAYHVVVSAAVDALDRWAGGGAAPPTAPRILTGDPAALDPILRDRFGLARGGIRLPQLEAPTAIIDGQPNPVPPGAGAVFQSFCRLFGRTIALPEATLRSLYPSHDAYVRAFAAAADRLVAAGFSTKADAEEQKAEAAATDIGKVGYVVAWRDGAVAAYGTASGVGTIAGPHRPVVGIDSTPSGRGYRLVTDRGGVFTFGDASFHGSTVDRRLTGPIVGIAGTPSGRGYWLASADGHLYAFGDARLQGSRAGQKGSPIVAIAANPAGPGYWLVARDGTVHAYGRARSFGSSAPGRTVVAFEPTPTGAGYLLLSGDGRVQAFGDALATGRARAGSVGIATSTSGRGYRVAESAGRVFPQGDPVDLGPLPRRRSPVVGIAALG